MEWNNKLELKFLELYLGERIIWDPNHVHHKDRHKVNEAWIRLSTIMNCTILELKTKKNSLMATFRMHCRKKHRSIKSGAVEIYQPVWFAYQLMEDFLAPVYNCQAINKVTADTKYELPLQFEEEFIGIDQKWSEDLVLKFLELYQNEPVIWDPKQEHNKSKKKVHEAWGRLSVLMNSTIVELKSKRNSLMATYRYLRRKKLMSINSGDGEKKNYQPIWFAYQLMEDFLASVYDCEFIINTDNNMTLQLQFEDTPIKIDQDDDLTNGNYQSNDFDALFLSQGQEDYQLGSEIDEDQNEMQDTFLSLDNTLSVQKENDDECDLYGKLLAKKLRNYSTYERHVLMHEIDGLLLKRQPNNISPSSSIPSPDFFHPQSSPIIGYSSMPS